MQDLILQTWESIQLQILDIIFLFFGKIDFSIFSSSQIIFDIALVTLIIYVILHFIVRIHVFQIIISIIILAILFLMSESFNLTASKVMLQGILILLLISIPIMFQGELRQAFEKVGYSPFHFFKRYKFSFRHQLIKSIKISSDLLAEKRHGALIVIEQTTPLITYAETGIAIGAKISKEILLNIFFPKSPLHDGAVIIRNNIILAAGSVLPLTHTQQEHHYGIRHKSALGLSENTDAIVVIVSEERGEISIAHNGTLIPNIDPDYLEQYLEQHIKK